MHLDPSSGFQTQVMTFSFDRLIDMIERNDLELCPYYKYSKDWQRLTRSLFIEAILLDIPINNLWFEQDIYGNFSVIDGTQCIKTVFDYVDGAFALQDLNIIDQLEGRYFAQLEYSDRIKIMRSEVIVRILNYNVAPLLKCELFKRITSGSIRGSAQLARNFAFRKAYDFIEAHMPLILDKVNFPINKNRYGIQKAESRLDQEQFFLCILLIQIMAQQTHELKQSWSLSFALDHVAMLLDEGELMMDGVFFMQMHQQVWQELVVDGDVFSERINLVKKNFSRLNSGYITMDRYLSQLLALACFPHLPVVRPLDEIHFFAPQTRLSRLYQLGV